MNVCIVNNIHIAFAVAEFLFHLISKKLSAVHKWRVLIVLAHAHIAHCSSGESFVSEEWKVKNGGFVDILHAKWVAKGKPGS